MRAAAIRGFNLLRNQEPDAPIAMGLAGDTAALALAASRTGALIGGFYLGIALGLLGVRDTPTGSASMAAALTSGTPAATHAALTASRVAKLSHPSTTRSTRASTARRCSMARASA